MRASEPTLSVSPAGRHSDVTGGDNFTRECLLSPEESVYRPKIRKGYLPKSGPVDRQGVGPGGSWVFGVMTQSGPVYGSLELVSIVAEKEWERIQRFHSEQIEADFQLVNLIDQAESERRVYWTSN